MASNQEPLGMVGQALPGEVMQVEEEAMAGGEEGGVDQNLGEEEAPRTPPLPPQISPTHKATTIRN